MSIQTQKNFFSLGYFGSMHRLPEELISLETLNVIKTHLSYKPKFKLPDFIDSLKIHSAHLVVGTPVPKLVFKPFTKGLVATSVGAVTLISENDFEAISLLGNNYPYVAKNSSKKTVAEVVRFMEDTFLGEEWHIAQSMHKNLLPYCCEMNAYISWSTVLALSECRY
jgi:hypothetical protein